MMGWFKEQFDKTVVGGDWFLGPCLCSFQNYSSGTDFAADT